MAEILVLGYHAASRTWPSELSLSGQVVGAHVSWLISRGYEPVTFSAAVARQKERAKLVATTFDDAFRSVYVEAFPVLAALGVPATVFVPTGFPDTERRLSWPGIDQWLGTGFADELTPMSWDEIGALASGGWEIGSHTVSHPQLPTLGDVELDDELIGSKATIEDRLGAPCTSLAYPYGAYDERVVAATHRAGYTCACTLTVRVGRHDALLWPRIGLYRLDEGLRFRLKMSRVVRRLRSTRGWDIVDGWRREAHGAAPVDTRST